MEKIEFNGTTIATKSTKSTKLTGYIATRTTGYKTIAGTVWSVTDCVRRDGPREWVALRGLCNGVPQASTTYRTKREALEALGLEDGEDTAILAAPWNATFVNGQTGQDVSDEQLEPGQFVRALKSEPREGGTEYRALVSSDGTSWYRYRSYERPFTR